jgi:hypothetical protein
VSEHQDERQPDERQRVRAPAAEEGEHEPVDPDRLGQDGFTMYGWNAFCWPSGLERSSSPLRI